MCVSYSESSRGIRYWKSPAYYMKHQIQSLAGCGIRLNRVFPTEFTNFFIAVEYLGNEEHPEEQLTVLFLTLLIAGNAVWCSKAVL